MFVDGVQVKALQSPDAVGSLTTERRCLGANTGVRSFSGSMDEVRFYGRVLNIPEIKELSSLAGE